MARPERGPSTVVVAIGDGTRSYGDQGLSQKDLAASLDAIVANNALNNGVDLIIVIGPGDYESGARAFRFGSAIIEGTKGTRIKWTATSPVSVTMPGTDVVTDPTQSVGTDVLGWYFPPDDGDGKGNAVTLRCLTSVGLTSTPIVSGHYSLVRMAAHRSRCTDVDWFNETSAVPDLTNRAPYKALSNRSVDGLKNLVIGADNWLYPDALFAQSVSSCEVYRQRFYGEPLSETSGLPRVTGLEIRKSANFICDQISWGDYYHTETRNISDVIFTGLPAAGKKVTINDFDPFTEEFEPVDFTFVNSMTPANFFEIPLLGPGSVPWTKELLSSILAANVTQVNASHLGPYGANGPGFSEGLDCSQYLGAGVTAFSQPVCRIQTLRLAAVGAAHSPSAAAYVTTDDSNITIRKISAGRERIRQSIYGLRLVDCMAKTFGSLSVGPDAYSESWFYDVATGANFNFVGGLWIEAGHLALGKVVAHTVQTGKAFIHFRSAAFSTVERGVQLGQIGISSGTAQPPVCLVEPGTHVAWNVTLSANVSNDDGFTLHDGSKADASADVSFRWKTSPAGGNPLEVAIGADARASERNMRKAIRTKYRAKGVHAFGKAPVQSGSNWVLQVEFWTETAYASTPTITKIGSNVVLTVANASEPALPFSFTWSADVHWPGTATNGALPVLWVKNCPGLVFVDGPISHVKNVDPSHAGRAAHNLVLSDLGDDTLLPNSTHATLAASFKITNNATTIKFEYDSNAHVVESGTLKRIDVSSGLPGSDQRKEYALRAATRINDFGVTLDVFAKAVLGFYNGLYLWAVWVTAKSAGVNASLMNTIAGQPDVSGTPIWGALNTVGGLGGAEATPQNGSADLTLEQQSYCLQFDDCRMVVVDGVAVVPFVSSRWASPGSSSVAEIFNGHTLDGSYIGPPMKLARFGKSNALYTSKAILSGCHAIGPMGDQDSPTSKNRLFVATGSMDPADITVVGCTAAGQVLS